MSARIQEVLNKNKPYAYPEITVTKAVTREDFITYLSNTLSSSLASCGAEFEGLVTKDYTSYNEASYELLTEQKALIQSVFDATLTQVQKPLRSIDKISKQYVDVRDSAKNNTKDGLTDAAVARLANLTKEQDAHRAVSREWFAKFLPARRAEEYMRVFPAAYKDGSDEAFLAAFTQVLRTDIWNPNTDTFNEAVTRFAS